MASSNPAPLQTAESEWLASTDLSVLVGVFPVDQPLNVICTSPGLAQQLARETPHKFLHPLLLGDFLEQSDRNEAAVSWPKLAYAIKPRGSTLILDPRVGHTLAKHPDAIEALADKTFDRLIFPAFASPTPFQIFYSEEFSFEEPVFDDTAINRWCWTVSDKPAFVVIQNREPMSNHRLSFTITGASSGLLKCKLGDEVQIQRVDEERRSAFFVFFIRDGSSLARIDISFSGEPLISDGSNDQRKALYFSFSGATVEAADKDIALSSILPKFVQDVGISDRLIRRNLHSHGFFEVQTLSTPWAGLSSLIGARSTFDYRCGFSFREVDCTPFGSAGTTPRVYGYPAIWYQARRTPTPGIEWGDVRDRLEAAFARYSLEWSRTRGNG